MTSARRTSSIRVSRLSPSSSHTVSACAAVLNERDALATMHSQFVVRLFYSLQTKDEIYLVMEYMIGGDLMSFLCIKQILERHEALFYTAEIAVALDYLHRKGVIHR